MKIKKLGSLLIIPVMATSAIACSSNETKKVVVNDSFTRGAQIMDNIFGQEYFHSETTYVDMVAEINRSKTIDELLGVLQFGVASFEGESSLNDYIAKLTKDEAGDDESEIKSYQINLSGNPVFDGTIKSTTLTFEFKSIFKDETEAISYIEFVSFAVDAHKDLIALYKEVSKTNKHSEYTYQYIEDTLMNITTTSTRYTVEELNDYLKLTPGIVAELPTGEEENEDGEEELGGGYVINSLRIQRISGVKKAYNLSFNINAENSSGSLRYVMRIQFALISSNILGDENV